MQNTMLDTTVSVPDQELSSVEYIDARENSIATITRDGASVQDVEDPRSLQLIFGQKHNDIDCALCPTAKRACNRAWVTAKQIENWSKMSTMTLWRWLERLEKARRIASLSDMIKTPIQDSCGVPHETTLYNLNVLNQLAMVCIDNEKLNEVSCKFSDILSEVETTGSYVVTKPEMSDEEIMSRALEIAHRTLALREECIKALEAERDEAIRTKAMIGSRREATAMATASAKSRECAKLTTENAELKDAVGRGTNWRTVAMMKAEWKREFGHEPSYHKLKKFSADLPAEMKPVKDVEEKFVLKNGGEKVSLVNRYHREAWARYREFEENLRVSAESRRDASNEGIVQTDTDTEIEYF